MLPDWPPATVTILVTTGADPHAIPVSAALRADSTHALIALASSRRSLERLRTDGRVALVIISEGIALTAHGRAAVVEEELVEGVVAVEIEVESVQDHDRPQFEIEAGVAWRWTDPEAEDRDSAVRAGLERLVARR